MRGFVLLRMNEFCGDKFPDVRNLYSNAGECESVSVRDLSPAPGTPVP